MGRISCAFELAAREDRALLITYLCAGDPDLEATESLALTLAESGADILELGVPFSEPTADGAPIQRAAERALKKGTSLAKVLRCAAQIRRRSPLPIVLFSYYNPIFVYGEEALAKDAQEAGVDGVLVVDLPPENATALRQALQARGIDFVPLVAPTSTESRVAQAAEAASAFIYYVSMTGVTGSKTGGLEEAAERGAMLQSRTGKPVAIGFGIQSPEDVRRAAAKVQGVVVGSAIVSRVEAAQTATQACEEVGVFVRSLAEACGRGVG